MTKSMKLAMKNGGEELMLTTETISKIGRNLLTAPELVNEQWIMQTEERLFDALLTMRALRKKMKEPVTARKGQLG